MVELQFGTGGDDAKNFVDELANVYLLYAAKKGLKTEILGRKPGNISIQVSGTGVWDAFKNEIGKHQVQRCPPNERHGRMHTSIISVGVLRLFDYKDKPLKESELETITQRGSGAGGQNQNKVNSAVRLKHLPTDLSVFINGRDQYQNKRKALEILTSRVNEHLYNVAHAAQSALKKEQMGDGDRTGKIRTYNFKNSLIHDHKLNKKTTQVKEVMKGNLDILLK